MARSDTEVPEIELSYLVVFCIVYYIILSSLWVVILTKNILTNLREYKYYKYISLIDIRVRYRILFNYKTVMIKDVFLIAIVLCESVSYIYWLIYAEVIYVAKVNFINSDSNCTRFGQITPWYNPVLGLPVVVIVWGELLISLFLLFSILSAYLSQRYYSNPLGNRVKYKYAGWWCFQTTILFVCICPYLQICLSIILLTLMTINWWIFFKETKKLIRAIRAVLNDIRYFDCDEERYRNLKASYFSYKLFIGFQLVSLAIFVFSMWLLGFFEILSILSNNCYFKNVYNVDINVNHMALLGNIAKDCIDYIYLTVQVLYSFIFSFPIVLVLIFLLRNQLYRKKSTMLIQFTTPLLA